jgi:CRP-like cAMP-binding protein
LYRSVFRRRLNARTQEVVDTLRSVPAFQALSSSALYAMAEACHRRSYRRGETLYYEGDPGLGLYVVEEGDIRLVTEPEPGVTRELRRLGRHDLFGVLSALGDFRRLETAETVAESQVLGFFRPDLKNVLKRHPKAGAEIASTLGRWAASQHVEYVRLVADSEGRERALALEADALEAVESAAAKQRR